MMIPQWNQKGATLSDKTARKEFGLDQEEIIEAIRQGKLQYRHNHVHGNPYLRLLRHEVEALVSERNGESHLANKKAEQELKSLKSEAKKLRVRLMEIEQRQAELNRQLGH